MDLLEKTVLAHRFLYYVKGAPVISDFEYDALEKRALTRFPNSVLLNSPGSDREASYPTLVKLFAETL